MNYYPFHMGDYATATRHLSWDEDAAYRRLLDAYYTHEKPLPTDLRAVFRLVIATTGPQREAVETVLREFFTLTDQGWHNKRAEAELDAMREKQQKQRDKANRRWDMQRAERGTASAMPQHQETNAAASKTDADAMPPTPTPTPTPTPIDIDARKRASSRGARLPNDWEPGESGLAFAHKSGLANGRVAAELEKFRDHWKAAAGQKALKVDWQAAWRTWVRNSIEFAPKARTTEGDPFAGAH